MPLRVPCPICGRVPPPECDCVLPPGPPDPPEERRAPGKPRREVVGLRRERRRGREVIVLQGLPPDLDRKAFARELKTRCGTGGTVKSETIEIQGDHREEIETFLSERGFRSKRTGG